MSTHPPRRGYARVSFRASIWNDDLAHMTRAAQAAAQAARARFDRDGVPIAELRACQADGRDGTDLTGCAKLYLPPPAGPFGMVFQLGRSTDGHPELGYVAFGLRHPPTGRRQSVYQLAHRRLHPPPPPT